MAYFFTESYTYREDVIATSSGGTDIQPPASAIDYDQATYWESDGATPSFIIDLGVARQIDSLFLLESMITTFKLYYSHNNTNWTEVTDGTKTEISADVWWWFSFTSVSRRYWKIEVLTKGVGNVRIKEFMLFVMKVHLAENDGVGMVNVVPDDPIGGSYLMSNGTTQSFAGSKEYQTIDFSFNYTTLTIKNLLYALYNTPTLRNPVVIIPDEDEPSKIYRCIWNMTKFEFVYQTSMRLAGYSGSLSFTEY